MPEFLPQPCPRCGADCAIVYGCGWDYDYIFCPVCNYEAELPTSTDPDDSASAE